ncbi:hypothetical protein [Ruegeria profundi]|uniref:hypothetical protein n=1 Tax=Ruegeria profundi TaxID=1685378 RepID=UPI003C7CD79F
MRIAAKRNARLVLLVLLPILGAGLAFAEGTGGISVELSSAEERDQNCLLSFLVENTYDADIESAVYETVLFGAEGGVALLTLLDFEDLPAGRPRVRQFQFDGMTCNHITRILINGAQECSHQGGMENACMSNLKVKSRLETEMIR